jgi:hypothetical protein
VIDGGREPVGDDAQRQRLGQGQLVDGVKIDVVRVTAG